MDRIERGSAFPLLSQDKAGIPVHLQANSLVGPYVCCDAHLYHAVPCGSSLFFLVTHFNQSEITTGFVAFTASAL